MKLITHSLVIFISLLSQTMPVLADSFSERYEIKRQIEESLSSIVKVYDPNAMVMVRVSFKPPVRVELPGTGALKTDIPSISTVGEHELDQLQIEIYTHRLPVPAKFNELIKSALSDYSKNPNLKIEDFPPEFAPSGKKESDGLLAEIGEHLDAISKSISSTLLKCLFVLAGLFLVSFFFRTQETKKVLSGIQSLASKLQEGRRDETSTQNYRDFEEKKERASPTLGAAPILNIDHFQDYPSETLAECIADCYWSKEDGYAAFLWNRSSISQRRDLLKVLPFLRSYIALLTRTPENNLKLISEPAYLPPLGLIHLNHASVTKLVKENPLLTASLSSLRLENLNLTIQETLDIRETFKNGTLIHSVNLGVEQLPPSPFRFIPRALPLKIESDQDEKMLEALIEPTLVLMEEVKSLIWQKELDEAALNLILEEFSARDIASAWIGTTSALTRLASCMPEKKRELVKSFAALHPPSRNSPIFRSLHLKMIQAIKKNETESSKVPHAA